MESKVKHSENVEKAKFYQCEMRCEDDKVYNHPDNCPVCKLKLQPVEHKNSHGYHIQYY